MIKRLVIALSFASSLAVVPAGMSGSHALAAGAPGSMRGGPTIYMPVKDAHASRPHGGGSNNLTYHGGNPAVETGADTVYLVFWGSQWGSCSGTTCSNDPSGEVGIEHNFFSGLGGSNWNSTVTQYCQGVANGSVSCASAAPGNFAANPKGSLVAGVIFDNTSPAPSKPTQSQLAAEAVKIANQQGNGAAANTHTQYVINTATGNNASGFGSQYCAWHSSTTDSTAGTVAYTNMPYVTDAGASCGANFNGLGPNAGITIVEGHEFAETETDIFPSGGWLDSGGSEIGDKCAWISSGQGASTLISLSTGTFPVQSLWSNAFNNNAGGCVISGPKGP